MQHAHMSGFPNNTTLQLPSTQSCRTSACFALKLVNNLLCFHSHSVFQYFLAFFSLSLLDGFVPAEPLPRLSSVPARRRCRTRAPRQCACSHSYT